MGGRWGGGRGEGGGGGGGVEEERIIDWTTQKLIVSLSSRIGMENCPKRGHCLTASFQKKKFSVAYSTHFLNGHIQRTLFCHWFRLTKDPI